MEPDFTKKEKEFIELVDYWDNIYGDYQKKGGKPDKGTQFMELVRKLKDDIIKKAGEVEDRKKRKEERKTRKAIKLMIECPDCKTMDNARPVGEGKNTLGHTVSKYFCSKCSIGYSHYYPNNDKDQLKWHKNFEKKYKKAAKKDKRFREQVPRTKKEIEKIEKYMEILRELIEKQDAAEKAHKEAEKTLNDLRDKYTAIMLSEKIKRTNTWGGEQGSS